jgi:transglutaminase-like putative cysteine protease
MTLALRLASLAFLAWHFALYFPGILEPTILVALTAAAFAGGVLTRQARGVVTGVAAVLTWLALRLFLVELPQGISSLVGAQPWDTFPLAADRHLWFALPGFAVAWGQGWWRKPGSSGAARERLVNALVLAGLFWAQGPYHVTLYASPFVFALVLLPYLANEGLLLVDDWRALSRRTVAGIGSTLVLLVAVVGLLWSLFGKYEELSTASGGGLMKPDLFQFDFSPLVRLESEISLSDHLVLLYREPGPSNKRYLRRFVLSGYDPAKGFFVDPPAGGSETPTPPVGRKVLKFPGNEGLLDRELVTQDYFLVNLDPSSLLALNAPTTVQPYAQWNKSSFVNAYHVESRVGADLYWELGDETDDGLSDAERQHDLVWGNDAELRAMALQVTAGSRSSYEKAVAIQKWLKSNFLYSLKPGSPGPEGALKHFLFESRKGYCSYFAFSMALMLRSVGVPARVSVGFLTNPREKVLDFYPVRAFQAHAWVEVPFGRFGWIDFDPTSETPAPGEGLTPPKAMDSDQMTRMIAEILQAQPVPLAESSPSLAQASQNEPQWQQWAQRWAVWVLICLYVVAGELYRARFRLGAAVAPPRQKTELAWRHLRWKARLAGCGPQISETPSQWAQRVGIADTWIPVVDRARYASEFTPAEAKASWTALKAPLRVLAGRRSLVRTVVVWLLPWWPSPGVTP